MSRISTDKFDFFGISASLACAIHCSVLPLAIAAGFIGNGLLGAHGVVESLFLITSLYFAIRSLLTSYREKHRQLLPLVLFVVGVLLIIIGMVLHGLPEIILATLGGLIIASAHFANMGYNRKLRLH